MDIQKNYFNIQINMRIHVINDFNVTKDNNSFYGCVQYQNVYTIKITG